PRGVPRPREGRGGLGEQGPAIGVASHAASGGGRSRRRGLIAALIHDWAVTLPFVGAIAWLLVGPAANLVVDSLRDPAVLAHAPPRRAIVSSLGVGVAVASLTTLIGVPLAWCISRLRIGSRSVAAAALNVAANIPATSLVFGFAAAFGGAGMVTLALRMV